MKPHAAHPGGGEAPPSKKAAPEGTARQLAPAKPSVGAGGREERTKESDTKAEADAKPESGGLELEEVPEGEAEGPEVELPTEEDLEGDSLEALGGGLEIVDISNDPEAVKRELESKKVEVKGDAGKAKGGVIDVTTGQVLIGCNVTVPDDKYATKTDLEGRFELDLPVKKLEVRIWCDGYEPRRFVGVSIAKDDTVTLDAELRPIEGAVQTVVVEAEANKESEGARMEQRRKSTETRDVMSRDEIKRSGGGSTSSAARRIVGASLEGGRFIFVRGLGHRYGNTLFDRARVPSPEPDLRTVPLDIFPAGALSAINVQKTFSADVPADFAGGSIQLESRGVPEKFVFDANVKVGANTRTTFQDILHSGGHPGYDAFGLGNIPRGLPDAIPRDHNLQDKDEDFKAIYSPQERERFGEAMNLDTRVHHGRIGPPNFGAGFTLGHGVRTLEAGKLGIVVAVDYANKFQNEREIRRFYALGDGGRLDTETPLADYKSFKTTQSVSWSTLTLLKWDVNKDHRLELSNFYSRDADAETREMRGAVRSAAGPVPLVTTRLRYIMRSVLTNRLGGSHTFQAAKGLKLDWFGSFAQARRDDPAIRENVYKLRPATNGYQLEPGLGGASQLFLKLVDNTENGAADVTWPFKLQQLMGSLKAGAWVEGKQRSFGGRRFVFHQVDGLVPPAGWGDIFRPDTIGGGLAPEPFFLKETTRRGADSYLGQQQVYAGYVKGELPATRWLRAVGGLRFESSDIRVSPFDPILQAVPEDQKINVAKVRDRDFLPSLSLIFAVRKDMNVRLAGTRTLARPEFRELAPFQFTDFVGGATVQGFKDLVSTKVWNADARWEWFPSASEVLALSAYYKEFERPIERVVMPASPPILSFRNARVARNVGVELEARKNLEFVHKKARDFSVGANFSYTFSRVTLLDCQPELKPGQDPSQVKLEPGCSDDPNQNIEKSTSRRRALQGLSPWVVNAYLAYDNARSKTHVRLLFNTFGRRISNVGGLGLPDMYEESVYSLDVAFSQELYKGIGLSFQAENLLDSPIRTTQGTDKKDRHIVNYVRLGPTFTLGLNYAY